MVDAGNQPGGGRQGGTPDACDRCGQVNPADAAFCTACGNRLSTPCRECGTLDTAAAQYCRVCGAARLAPSQPLPAPEGERRIITSLFADLVGSTTVASRLDPEEWTQIAHEALSAMSEAVARYGGTVARLMGDGLLAFFGAPTAHEDDAERAVRAGLDLVGDIRSWRADLAGRPGLGPGPSGDELMVRVGVTTGEVVAGAVGGDVRSEYTALGDSVNLASRLQGAAEPGSVLVSEETRRRVEHAVVTVPVGGLRLKGYEALVQAHRVEGLRAERTSDRGHAGEAPSVGREAERSEAELVLEDLARGRSAILAVIGDAGLGKSRLVADLARSVALQHPTVRWFGTECLSFEASMPFSLARRFLDTLGGPDTPGLRRRLADLPPARASLLQELLWSIGRDFGSAEEMNGEALAQAFGETVVSITGEGPEAVPAVVAVDDLHWADAASADLLASLLALTDRIPVVFLLAARPDRSGPAHDLLAAAAAEYPDRYTALNIRPLDSADARLLAGALVAGRLPDEAVARIADRSEGNPYFLEELARELAEAGQDAGVADWVLPVSLQTLLQARFDRLGVETRATLEVAAVVGRVFDVALVEEVRGIDVTAHLRELLRVGLVEEHEPRSRTFAFRHTLAQEAASRAMLGRHRQELHRRVGEALEIAAGTGIIDEAPVLAHHFLAAGDSGRGSRWSLRAGDRAIELGANADALGHYERGIEAVDDRVDRAVIAGLLLGRGRARDRLGDLEGARADVEAALGEARRIGDRDLEWRALIALGELWAAQDYGRTGDHFERALELARRGGDEEQIAISLNRLGNWYVNAADPGIGIGLHREALAIFGRLGSKPGVAASHDLLGMASAVGRGPAEAGEHYALALSAFRELGDREGLAGALISSTLGAPNYEVLAEPPMLDADEAMRALEEAFEIVRALGWAAAECYAGFIAGQVMAITGDLGAGVRQGEEALTLARRIEHEQWTVAGAICLGAIETDILDLDAAIAHLRDGLEGAEHIASLNWILVGAALLGRALVERGEPEEAARVTGRALALPAAERFRPHLGCLLVRGWAAARMGSPEETIRVVRDVARARGGGDGEATPFVALVHGEALADVDPGAARGVLEAGLAASRRWRMPTFEWRLLAALAHLGGEGAAGELAAARRLIDRCAATLDERRGETFRRGALRRLHGSVVDD